MAQDPLSRATPTGFRPKLAVGGQEIQKTGAIHDSCLEEEKGEFHLCGRHYIPCCKLEPFAPVVLSHFW
jgi:hypothetical protein